MSRAALLFSSLPSRSLRAPASQRIALLPSRRWLSDSLKQMLDKEVKESPVVLFMKGTPDAPRCGYSRAAVQILQVQGVDFGKQLKSFNVLEDEDLRSGIKEYSNWPTIPQIYVKGEFIGGTDILYNMHQSGELEDLLVKEGIVPKDE